MINIKPVRQVSEGEYALFMAIKAETIMRRTNHMVKVEFAQTMYRLGVEKHNVYVSVYGCI